MRRAARGLWTVRGLWAVRGLCVRGLSVPGLSVRGLSVLCLSVMGLWLALAPAGASAQAIEGPSAESTVVARARHLFERALDRLRSGEAAEGRDLLRRSLVVLPNPSTRFNLAMALRRTGELTEAEFHLRVLLEDPDLPARRRALIREQLRSVSAQVAILEIRVEGAADATVDIDGVESGQARAGEPLRVEVDPGTHHLVARAGALRGSEEVDLPVGSERAVELSLEPVAEVEAWPWALLASGALVVGVAVGVILAVVLQPPSEDELPFAVRVEALGVRF